MRGLVPERMLQLHRLVEGLLRLGRAGDRKVDRAEHRMAGMLVGGARGRRDEAQENRQERCQGLRIIPILHALPASVGRPQVGESQYGRRLAGTAMMGPPHAQGANYGMNRSAASAHRRWLSIQSGCSIAGSATRGQPGPRAGAAPASEGGEQAARRSAGATRQPPAGSRTALDGLERGLGAGAVGAAALGEVHEPPPLPPSSPTPARTSSTASTLPSRSSDHDRGLAVDHCSEPDGGALILIALALQSAVSQIRCSVPSPFNFLGTVRLRLVIGLNQIS